jgi:hypothetical protein
MKIYRPNGTVIEMTVDEYKQAFVHEKKIEVVTKAKDYTPTKKQKKDMKAMFDLKGDEDEILDVVKQSKSKLRHRGGTVSSFKKWTKAEEKILMENTIRKAKKLLGRTIQAIYSRRSLFMREHPNFKPTVHARSRKNIGDFTAQSKRMKWILDRRNTLKKLHPEQSQSELMKEAFAQYSKYAKGEKDDNSKIAKT